MEFPVEVVGLVMEQFQADADDSDRKDLWVYCRVSSMWREAVAPYIYNSLSLTLLDSDRDVYLASHSSISDDRNHCSVSGSFPRRCKTLELLAEFLRQSDYFRRFLQKLRMERGVGDGMHGSDSYNIALHVLVDIIQAIPQLRELEICSFLLKGCQPPSISSIRIKQHLDVLSIKGQDYLTDYAFSQQVLPIISVFEQVNKLRLSLFTLEDSPLDPEMHFPHFPIPVQGLTLHCTLPMSRFLRLMATQHASTLRSLHIIEVIWSDLADINVVLHLEKRKVIWSVT